MALLLTDGTPLTVSTTIPGQNFLITFSGSAGQRISLNEVASFANGADVTVKDPNGNLVASNFVLTSAFVEPFALPLTGTYTIRINPRSSGTGGVTLRAWVVPDDTGGAITTDGTPVLASTSVAGQNAEYTFAGTATQRISLNLIGSSFAGGADITIKNPDGSTLVTAFTSGNTFIDTRTLVATGTHKVVVNPRGANTGSVTLRLYDVPPDTTGTLAVNGGEQTFANTTPGQNGTFTFAGTAGQSVTVRAAGSTLRTSPCVQVRLLRQDGTTQLASFLSCALSFSLAPQNLPASETYIVQVNPQGALVGSVRISVTNP